MALSGLEIYKLLPRTNCKKCGFQTCLAFAMQLAKKAVALDKCPFVAPEVRAVLEEASMPAIRLAEFGASGERVRVGNETVMFRHEEKFHRPTAIGLILEDDLSDAELVRALGEISKLEFERVGQKIQLDLIALRQKAGAKDKFLSTLAAIKKISRRALVLMPADGETLREALTACGGTTPLVYCAQKKKIDEFSAVCKEYKAPFAFRGDSVSEFSQTTKRLTANGVNDLVLDIADHSIPERIRQLTQIRRLAIRKLERSLGFPSMVVLETDDARQMCCEAAAYISKYASIILLKNRKPEYIMPILTLRQNIYTDPQKPLQVEPNVYQVGAAGENSPVLVTTNFSLTYYTVLGEIESSRVPSHLVCIDTEGMSVLTAWAAEKFSAERIADSLSRFKISDVVKHKNLIIPGYVAMISGDLEDKSGWKIFVGPKEAAGIQSYLKNLNTATN